MTFEQKFLYLLSAVVLTNFIILLFMKKKPSLRRKVYVSNLFCQALVGYLIFLVSKDHLLWLSGLTLVLVFQNALTVASKVR